MDLQELKDIIKKEGGKIIIVENDRPEVVVMSFEEWRGAKKHTPAPQTTSEERPQARETNRVEPAPAPTRSEDTSSQELTIDDLPL